MSWGERSCKHFGGCELKPEMGDCHLGCKEYVAIPGVAPYGADIDKALKGLQPEQKKEVEVEQKIQPHKTAGMFSLPRDSIKHKNSARQQALNRANDLISDGKSAVVVKTFRYVRTRSGFARKSIGYKVLTPAYAYIKNTGVINGTRKKGDFQ
jgi:hypothetical protein